MKLDGVLKVSKLFDAQTRRVPVVLANCSCRRIDKTKMKAFLPAALLKFG